MFTNVFVFLHLNAVFHTNFHSLVFKRLHLSQKCPNKFIGKRNTTLQLLTGPWVLQCGALHTDRQTDRQHYDAKSKSTERDL